METHSLDDRELLVAAATLAQRLIRELHARAPDSPTFTQSGLLDGLETVTDYLRHGEPRCAVHHLLYMIHSADIAFRRETVVELHAVAERIGEPNPYAAGAEARMTPEQQKWFFNRL